MKRLGILLVALIAGAVLASCATLSEEQCQTGDWRSIGFDDGARGRPPVYLANHTEACSEYGIAVDSALYADGRRDGLRTYCRLSNAERLGRDGERYHGVCEGEIGQAFARIHALAEDIYDAESELDSLDSEIDAKLALLSRNGLTEDQVADLTRDIRGLQRERQSDRMRIRMLEMRLSTARRAEEARLGVYG